MIGEGGCVKRRDKKSNMRLTNGRTNALLDMCISYLSHSKYETKLETKFASGGG